MMRLRVTSAAESDAALFLRGANLAFEMPGHDAWGDEAMFDWAFRRTMSGRAADLLFLDEGAVTLAGSAITWRTVRFPDGSHRLAAIMTGSWTVPAARGRGAFSRMLEATREVAQEHDALLLGFGRMENASRRRFEAAGARLHPSFYCRSLPLPGLLPEELPIERLTPEPRQFDLAAGPGFVYTEAEWRSQFLERPHAHVECIGERGAWAAIVETAGGTDRVHAVTDDAAIPRLAARAHAQGRRLFWYTTAAPPEGCERIAGFLSQLGDTSAQNWHFQNGDRM